LDLEGFRLERGADPGVGGGAALRRRLS